MYISIVISVLLYAMFPSFWYLDNTGCQATNDTMHNMSCHLPLLQVKALKAPLTMAFFQNYWWSHNWQGPYNMNVVVAISVGCTASYFVKIIWCSCWFCNPPPLFWGLILLILRSPKGGCCSISNDLSCSYVYDVNSITFCRPDTRDIYVFAQKEGHYLAAPLLNSRREENFICLVLWQLYCPKGMSLYANLSPCSIG